MNSHNPDEIQTVESDRELFTSATDVFMSIDPEKLRQAQQAECGPYFAYLCDPKKRPRTIVKTGAFYIDLISPVIFIKEVRSAISL